MNPEENSSRSFKEEWKKLNDSFPDLEALQKSCFQTVTNLKRSEDQFKKSILHHMKSMERLSAALSCLRPSTEQEKEEFEDLRKKAVARKEELRCMLATMPKENGFYLKIVLGNVNVTLLNQEEKYKYKDEYERFKLMVTIVVLILSFLNIVTSYRALDSILHFLLVWYYCTLTIRESILVVNGSRIKGWWRVHHFVTTLLTGVLILWHDGKSYQIFRPQFMWYLCYSSFLQFLQYNYQQGCLYRLRALGERPNMDITIDGFHSWMWRGLKFLLPFLVIGYCWQLYNSYALYQLCRTIEDIEWQVPAASFLFLVLFFGNSLTTLLIVHQKLNLRDLFVLHRKLH